jgi:hypothetical protein
MTDEITNVQSGYFTQERIQGDLDIAGRRKSQKRCSMTASFLWMNSTN